MLERLGIDQLEILIGSIADDDIALRHRNPYSAPIAECDLCSSLHSGRVQRKLDGTFRRRSQSVEPEPERHTFRCETRRASIWTSRLDVTT